jgi:hydroxymethylpyrimidine/phosphomethylpyrimidine kinase
VLSAGEQREGCIAATRVSAHDRNKSVPNLERMPAVPTVLSIAGSDSGGGAGIQADLKAFARCGVHGMTAITALTAQSTVGVTAIHPIPRDFIVEQVRVVHDDLGVDAVKIGMLGTAETVRAVSEALDLLDADTPIVIDPVMVAESGAVLLDDAARAALVRELIPRATVVTPNVPEARVLAGEGGEAHAGAAGGGEARAGAAGGGEARGGASADPEGLARAIYALGPQCVVVTGGHRDNATDLFFDGDVPVEIPGPRHPDGAAHGSGCTHSSALAAYLALGRSPLEAAREARKIAAEAVRAGLRDLGRGAGPVDVFDLTSRTLPAATRRVT